MSWFSTFKAAAPDGFYWIPIPIEEFKAAADAITEFPVLTQEPIWYKSGYGLKWVEPMPKYPWEDYKLKKPEAPLKA